MWIIRPAFSLLELLVVLAIIAILMALGLAGVQKVRAASARAVCLNQLRQVAMACHNYVGSHGHLPSGCRSDEPKEKYPFLSWQAVILPQIERDDLWREVEKAYASNRDFLLEPPHEIKGTVVPLYGCPSDPNTRTAVTYKHKTGTRSHAPTSYLGVNGLDAYTNKGVLYCDSATRFADISDGLSSTLMIGERPPTGPQRNYGWWYGGWGTDRNGDGDTHLGVRTKEVGSVGRNCRAKPPFPFVNRSDDDPCAPFQFWSKHPGGAHFAFADGSARFVSYSADAILPALSTRAGGETVEVP